MEAIRKLIIPVFSVIGMVLLVLTIIDFDDDNICSSCWPVQVNLYFTYFLSVLSIVAAAFATVSGAMDKPDSIKSSAIGIGAMLAITLVSYLLANGDVLSYYPEGTSETAVKWSDTGLYMLYILTFLSVISIVYSGVAKILNK